MLYEFLTTNRTELIERCEARAAARFLAVTPSADPAQGVPVFLDRLVTILCLEQNTSDRPKSGEYPTSSAGEIGRDAALNGADLMRRGFTVDQVVHGYGDICQSVTEMAIEQAANISADEFRTLNRCLDDAIADAVTAFGSARQTSLNQQAESLHDSLSAFSDKQRQLIAIAFDAYSAIKTGNIGLNGATGTVLFHALQELQVLSERTIPDIRLSSALTTLPPS